MDLVTNYTFYHVLWNQLTDYSFQVIYPALVLRKLYHGIILVFIFDTIISTENILGPLYM